MKPRAGSTLVELLTTLTVLGIVAVACASLIRTQSILLKHTSEHAAAAEALRAGRTVMRAELQDQLAPDRHVVAPDSIAMRVFRGIGIICSTDSPRVTMRYRGVRQPDPAKDSIIVAGSERIGSIRLLSSRIDACPTATGEQLIAIELDSATTLGDAVLFYETGAYHLASRALRYRRGASGLQPITDDFIDHGRSHFATTANGAAVDVVLMAGPPSGQQSVSRVMMRNR